MANSNLNDVVRSVIVDFVKGDKLFTGLDVSNEVKNLLPFARHSEVSDLVRQMFPTDMETSGYGRTPIDVTLKDGSSRTAMLYHPLSDSWDLDSKYDTQMRAQTANKPVKAVTTPNVTVMPVPANATVVAPATIPVPAPAPTPAVDARTQWNNLFASQPSLFPRR